MDAEDLADIHEWGTIRRRSPLPTRLFSSRERENILGTLVDRGTVVGSDGVAAASNRFDD